MMATGDGYSVDRSLCRLWVGVETKVRFGSLGWRSQCQDVLLVYSRSYFRDII